MRIAPSNYVNFPSRFRLELTSIFTFAATGIQSLLLIAIASRSLNPSEMAKFLVSWSIVFTALLSLFGPLEALAPRFLTLANSASNSLEARSFMLKMHIASSILLTLVLPFVLSLIIDDWRLSPSSFAVLGIFVFSFGFFSYIKCEYIGRVNLGYVAKMSGFALVVFLFSFLLVPQIIEFSIFFIYLAMSGAYALPALITMRSRSNRFMPMKIRFLITSSSSFQYFKTYASVAVSGALGLIPGAIVLPIALRINVDDLVIVAYAAAVSLARGMFMATNSLSMAFSVRYARSLQQEDFAQFLRVQKRHYAVFSAGTIIFGVFAFMAGNFVTSKFIDSEVPLSSLQITMIFIGEGLLAATVVPRMSLISIEKVKSMSLVWIASSLIGLSAFLVPLQIEWRLVLYPVFIGFIALALLGGLFQRVTNDKDFILDKNIVEK